LLNEAQEDQDQGYPQPPEKKPAAMALRHPSARQDPIEKGPVYGPFVCG
jgi:hypothetical protein